MRAIQAMMDEHQRILRVLDALDGFADADGGAPADKLELGHFVRFFREYADERHHGKEEHVLFAAMARNGFPPEQSPVGLMVQEHQEMRELVSVLRALAEQGEPWSAADRKRASEGARSYASALREHIMKEDEMLYPMATEHLPPRVQAEIDAECSALDERGSSTDAALEEVASRLVARYAPRP